MQELALKIPFELIQDLVNLPKQEHRHKLRRKKFFGGLCEHKHPLVMMKLYRQVNERKHKQYSFGLQFQMKLQLLLENCKQVCLELAAQQIDCLLASH
jgi:hypothetical protein